MLPDSTAAACGKQYRRGDRPPSARFLHRSTAASRPSCGTLPS